MKKEFTLDFWHVLLILILFAAINYESKFFQEHGLLLVLLLLRGENI